MFYFVMWKTSHRFVTYTRVDYTTNEISKIEQDLKVSVESVKSMILKNFIEIYETEH